MRHLFNCIWLTFAFVLFALASFAQKNLAKGDKLFDRNLFKEAIPYYLAEQKEGDLKSKETALEKLAKCYRITGEFEKAEETYKKILKKNKKNPDNFLNYAMSLKASAKYDEAEKQFKEYKKLNPSDKMADIYIKSCALAQQWLDEGVGNDVRNIEAVNTENPEFSPVMWNNKLVYASSKTGSKRDVISFNGGNDVIRLDLYAFDMNKAIDDPTNKSVPLEGVNTSSHEASPTFSSDGKTIYFTRTVTGKRDKKTNTVLRTLQVFVSHLDTAGKWSEATSAFDFNSDKYSVGQPSITPDGKRIFFMSDMPGGYGATDIYYSDLQSNGEWGKPMNAGGEVNTFGHEMFPFIRNNNELFFSSDTHPGMGKLDIFSSTLKDGKWTNVLNMRTPINSIADDFGIYMDTRYRRGFLSSNRFNGKGDDDIYSYVDLGAMQLSINGGLLQLPDNTLFDGIKYKLINDETKEETILEPKNGMYSVEIPEGKNYTLSARKEGFAYNKINLKLISRNTDKRYLELDIKSTLKPVKINGMLLEKPNGSDTEAPVTDADVVLKDSVSPVEKKPVGDFGEFEIATTLNPNAKYKLISYRGLSSKNGVVCTGIIKSEGKPLKNATIKVLNDLILEDQVRTDETGRYTVTLKLDMDEYMLFASLDGYRDNFFETVTYGKKPGDVINKDIELQAIEPVPLSGIVHNTGGTLENTQVSISYNKEVVGKFKTEEDGKFNFTLQPDRTYIVTATKAGHFQKEIEVSTFGKGSKDLINIDMLLDTIQVNKTVEIKNIYYDYNKTELRFDSYSQLDKLVQFLNVNPSISIELRAHTDSRGADDYNLKLSEGRAQSCVDYLVSKGIAINRITAKGLGETEPIKANAQTEADHQLNRRTELKILKM